MTEIYSLTVLDSRRLQSRCISVAAFSPKALGENPSLLLPANHACITPVSASVSSEPPALRLCAQNPLSLTKTPVIGFRAQPKSRMFPS